MVPAHADEAGLRPEDLIVSLDGQPLDDVTDVQRLMVAELIGKRVEAVAIRGARTCGSGSSRQLEDGLHLAPPAFRSAVLPTRWGDAEREMDRGPCRAGGAPQWDALTRSTTPASASSAWYLAWWDGYRAGELRVCTVWNGSELRGMLPLCERNGRLEAMANEEAASCDRSPAT